jgi:putative transposase
MEGTAVKEWLSPQEIADAALQGLPGTKMGITLMAQREQWDAHPAFARRRQGRGGGMEYSYRILPSVAQVEYFQRHALVSHPAETEASAPAVTPANGVTGRALQERDARLAIVAAFDRFAAGLKLRHMSCLQIFCDKYNLGTLAIDAWVKDLVPSVSKRSLDRWRAAQKAGTAIGYDPGQSRKGTGVLERAENGRVAEWMLALVAFEPQLSCEDIQTQCRAKFGDTLNVAGKTVPMPPVRAFQRALKALKSSNQVLLTKITNPDRYRSHLKPSGTGSYRYLNEPNALWMIDASPVDALCIDGRHSIYACIDVATRRVVITVARTPRASAVALMMRKACLQLGVPQVVKTDNGSDFVARETQRLFDNLRIGVDVCDPYSPEQKAHVERVIKTFQHMVGPSLPGFIGHSVSDRKAIEERKTFAARLGEDDAKAFAVSLTAAELQRYIDQWLATVYQHREHAGLGKRTPFAVAAASTVRPRMVDARAFDMLLMPVAGSNGTRRVTKLGVRIDHYHYSSPFLLPAQDVFVRRDPLDLGKVFVFSPDGAQFICEAICPELAGVDPAAFHQARREVFAERMRAAERGVRADMSEIALEPLIAKMLEVKARDVPNVIALPKSPVEHTSPQIEAAIAAMSPRTPVPLADDVSALHAELMDEFVEAAAPLPANVTLLRATLTPAQLFRKARDLELRIAAGETIDQADAIWLGGYRQTAAYQTQRELHEDFGDQALT